MDVRWNELKQSLRKVSSGNLSTGPQSNSSKKVLYYTW